jgi:hypothetical protein
MITIGEATSLSMVQSGGVAANSGIRTFNTGGNLVQKSNTQVTRWYPTAHVLEDGRVMMVGGSDKTGTAPKYHQARLTPLFRFLQKRSRVERVLDLKGVNIIRNCMRLRNKTSRRAERKGPVYPGFLIDHVHNEVGTVCKRALV